MKYIINFIIFIISTILAILFIDSSKEHGIETQKQILIKQAQIHFYDQVNTRHWNAGFGGVYVKPLNKIKPNKYLLDNTLKVDENLTLIKINPAWMTRQLSEQLNISGFEFRITSLNPINPNNTPNNFEKKALQYIEAEKANEYYEFNKSSFNYMGALVTEKPCLKCHAIQGYKVGDIRGGISIKLGLDEYNKMVDNIRNRSYIIKIAIILFLITILILIHSQLKSNDNLQNKIKERTKELELEKNYTNKILDTNPDIVIVTNGTKIIEANKSFFRFFKYDSIEEFLKDHECICDYFITFNGKDFPKDNKIEGKLWAEYILDHLGINHIVKVEIDNEIFFFNLNASRLSKEEILVILTNVTDLKMQEEQLHKSERMASMGEMIGNIAHQWRQPLSVISTSATGIKMQSEFNTLEQKQLFSLCDAIDSNAQYLSKTIDDFRNFIKGDTKPINFNLKNDTDSFIKLVDSSIRKYNIQVILDLEENIEIKGYPNELIQCFINIFNNAKDALQYIDEEARYIFISQHIDNDKIVIEFKDNAGGIPEDIISKIFDPYFTTKHQRQGTGLGLHMTYNLIVNGMNGNIKVENEEFKFQGKDYKGAKFSIIIPYQKA